MNAKPDKSRLGELLVDMRLVDEETLQTALADQRATGVRLATALARRRVLDEERLTKAVAARLGLEAVSVASHKIHERVLNLIPYQVAKRYGLLPIAIKRTQQAEVLYLVMVDPLNTEALGEVQRITGRQVRVLMATASELDQCIDTQYKELEAKLAQGGARTPRQVASRPPIVAGTGVAPGVTPSSTPPVTPSGSVRPARRVSVPGVAPPRAPSAVSRPPPIAARPPPPAAPPPPPSAPSRPTPSGIPQQARPAPSRPGELRPPRQTPPSRPAAPPPPSPPRPSEIGRVRTPPPQLEPSSPAPATSPGPRTAPAARTPPPPLDLNNPATLIDTARPPEIEGLSKQLGISSAPVVPQDLDPPDAVATRIDADPYARPSAGGSLDPQAKDGVDWELGAPPWDQPGVWGALGAEGANGEAPSAQREVTNLDDQWAQATGLDMGPPQGMDEDGPEEIATSQLELSEESKAALQPSPAVSVPTLDKRTLASTLELPVALQEEPNPFEGPAPGDVRVGLERTGIFPAVDFEAESFEPPALPTETPDALASLGDIPESEAAVRARFGDPAPSEEDDDAIEAIEEVMLEPLDDEPLDDEPLDDAPMGGEDDESLDVPEPSDREAMPVIEPSSLVSLMDDEDAENADTGSAEVPLSAKRELPTRVFDEANREIHKPPQERAAPGEAEEPTNPRMQAPEVPAAPPPLKPRPKKVATPPAPEAPPPVAEADPSAEASPAPTQEEPAPPPEVPVEEPTPAQDPVERADVLDALEGAFVPREASASVAAAPPPREDTPSENRDVALGMLDRLMAGESLSSAERAQVLLAVTRRLVAKGILTREELLDALVTDD